MSEIVTHGAPHEAPPNWREVSEAEFVEKAMRRIYSPDKIEYRSFPIKTTRPDGTERTYSQGIHCFWYYNGRGDAIGFDYWGKRVRFFLFAECEHQMVHTKNLGRCYNEYTCSKCGYVENIDSSD